MPSFLSLILFTLYFTISPITSVYANEDKVWVTYGSKFDSCTKLEDNKDRTVLKCNKKTTLTLDYETSILTIVDSRDNVFTGEFGCSEKRFCSSYVRNEKGEEKRRTTVGIPLGKGERCGEHCYPLF